MNEIIKLCIGVLIVCIIVRALQYKSEIGEIPNFAEEIFNGFKAIGYFLLAWYIYSALKRAQFPKIDVLTFLLACLEATHNFMNSLGNWVALMIAIFILPKRKY